MELTFNKVKDKYEAEFEITNDANLHIEFKGATPIKLYQKTAGNNYDLITDNPKQISDVIDVDLVALVYPKFIKVECATQPTKASVISNGEISPSGGGGGSDEWRYYTMGNVLNAMPIGFLVGVVANGKYRVTTPAVADTNIANWKTIAVNYDAKFSIVDTAPASLNEMIASEGMTRQEFEAAMEIVEITEEQFYNYQ